MRPFIFVLLSVLSLQAWAQIKIEGRLYEKGTRIPLAEVNVFILPHKLKAITDVSGDFIFENVPAGPFQFVVNQTGYEKLEQEGLASVESNGRRTLFLEKTSYSVFETTVVGKKQTRDDSQRSLKQAQFSTIPGAGGDPVKAVQNLPGVNRVSGFSSQVVIQGSSPQDTRYDIDGHEIPTAFHFGGLTSVVMPEAIDQVDYLSAGYGPEYSRAMGGIVSLKTRDPDVKGRDRKGFFFVDTLKSGALVEGKINDHSSYLVSGRYSYIGFVLKQALKDNDSFDLTVAPEFSDFTVLYKNQWNERDSFKLDFIGSRDTLSFLFKEPLKADPKLRGNFSNETHFIRAVPQWTRKVSADQTFRVSAGFGKDLTQVDIGDNYFRNSSWSLTTREEWEQKWTAQWIGQLGLDTKHATAKVDFKLPQFNNTGGVGNPISSSEQREANLTGQINDIGFYSRNEIQIQDTPFTVLPHIRFDYFSLPKETLVAPRLGARWKVDESLTWRAATGLYFQPPPPQEIDSSYGNPAVRSPSAIHYTFGFEKDFREQSSQGLQWTTSYFRRDFRNLIVSSSNTVVRDGLTVPEVYNNSGGGRSQGVETQIKFDFAPWSGWVSYTYSQSKRWDPQHTEYDFQYDQTHNFNIVGAYDAPRNWKYSARYRYVTGNPYTPVVSSTFDADNGVYIPTRGPIYSEREKPFTQLDIRIDKKWILDTEIWSLYLDIQNVLNTKNSEQIRYSYDYSQKETVSGAPILPSLGVKGEF